jgi:hypothetical protein
MSYTKEELDYIFDSQCSLCDGKIRRNHYGRTDSPYGWEADHNKPKARGGSDKLTNLQPAHPRCNRSKQAMTTRSYRRLNGVDADNDTEIAFLAITALGVASGTIAYHIQPNKEKRLASGILVGGLMFFVGGLAITSS